MRIRVLCFVLTTIALSLTAAAPASAEPAAALLSGNRVATFDTAVPGSLTAPLAITGLQTTSEHVVGIDLRPATNQVYIATVPTGATSNAAVHTYVLDPATGQATSAGAPSSPLPLAGDVATGFDINPRLDQIRFVDANDENARLSPVDGALIGDDTNLTPAEHQVVAVAYDLNGVDRALAPTQTTLYGIARSDSTLVRVGGINGTPSPDGGQLTTVGPLGVPLDPNGDDGLDISGFTGTAYALLNAGKRELYRVNTATGAATLLDSFRMEVVDLTILPPAAPAPLPPGTGGGGGGGIVPERMKEPVAPPIELMPAPPTGTMKLPKNPKLDGLIAGRLKVSFTCDRACQIVALIRSSSKPPKAAAALTIAKGRASLPAAGRGTVTLKPTRAGKKAMRRLLKAHRNMRATITMTIADGSDQGATVRRKLALKH